MSTAWMNKRDSVMTFDYPFSFSFNNDFDGRLTFKKGIECQIETHDPGFSCWFRNLII